MSGLSHKTLPCSGDAGLCPFQAKDDPPGIGLKSLLRPRGRDRYNKSFMDVFLVNHHTADLPNVLAALPRVRVHALVPRTTANLTQFLAEHKFDAAIVPAGSRGLRPRTILQLLHQHMPDCAVILLDPSIKNRQAGLRPVNGFDAVAWPKNQKRQWAALLARADKHAKMRTQAVPPTATAVSPRSRRMDDPAWYRALADTASDAIFMLDWQGNLLYANRAAERLFGYDGIAQRGMTIFDLLDLSDSPYADGFREYLETGHTFIHWQLVQMWGRTATSERIPIELTFSHFTQNGEHCFTLFVRNVTERKRVEDALRASQKYAENIVDSSLDMIIATDVNRRIIEFNRAAELAFGYERSQVFGQDVRMLYAGTVEGQTVFEDMVRYGKTVRHIVNRRKNGETFHTLLSASTLHNVDGQVIGFMGVSRDITVEQELEKQLRGRIELLEALSELDRALATPLPLRDLLPILTDHAARRLNASTNALWLYEPAQSQLRLVVMNDSWQDNGQVMPVGEGLAGRIAAARQIESSNHLDAGHLFMLDTVPNPRHAAIGAPLLYHGELLGVLLVAREVAEATPPATNIFTTADIQALNLVASRAASAIHTTHLWEETTHRAEQLALLYDAGLTLNNVLEPRTQLEFLSKIAMRVLNAERAVFFRHDADTRTLAFEFGLGGDQAFSERMSRASCLVGDDTAFPGWVSERRVPLNLPDLNEDPRWQDMDPQINSGLWVPVEHGGALLGVLAVFAAQPYSFNTSHERLLTLFANQAAVALENARIFAALKLRIDELQALNQISEALSAVTTRQEMLPQFLDASLAALGAPVGAILLYESVNGRLQMAAAHGSLAALQGTLDPEYGVARRVLDSGQAYVSSGQAGPGEPFPAGWNGICAPLRSGDEKIGVLLIADESPRQFARDQVQLVSILCEMAGNTLHRLGLLESLADAYFQVERAKREWEQSVDTIEEAISMVDADGKILRVNHTMATWLEQTAQDLIGQECCQVIDACALPPASCPHAQLMQARDKIYRADVHSEHLNKSLSFTSYPIYDAEHQFVGAVNVLKDISVERDLQAQLIQSEKMAATGRLAASIAHEINNPLQGIQGSLELAYNFRGDKHKQERYLSLAKGELDGLVGTVQRMLDFYRPAKGTRTPVELQALVDDVLALSANRISSGRVRVELNIDPGLPALNVVGNQIKQVILNLLLNAIEAMPDGGTLTIKAHYEDDGVKIQFKDTGEGIFPSQLDKIFEPFYTTKPNGTGLGLGVCHNIITHHGGRLTVTSALGRGSTFTVWLPDSAPFGGGS